MSLVTLADFNIGNKNRYKDFLRTILPITIPIVLQSTLTAALGMLDVIMLGHMGDLEISTINVAAASQGNRSFFVILLIFFGFAAGASIFFSQLYGKKDIKGIRKILGVVMILGLIVSLIPLLSSIFIPKVIMGMFIDTADTAVLNLGADFISIIGLSYPMMFISVIYGFALRSIGNAKVPMVAGIIALMMNGLMNYLFIYGVGPIPAMGAVGAAIGTLISRFIEFLIIIFYIYSKKTHPLKASFKELTSFNKSDISKYFKISSYVIIEEGVWGAAMTTQFAIFGYMGRTTAAASSIAIPFIELSLVIFFAISQGTAIIVGNMIGAGRSVSEIRWVSWKCVQLSFLLSFVVALVFGVIPYYLIPILYNVDPGVISLAQKTMVVFAVFLLVRGVELVGSIGVLRGAGDTMYTMMINVLGAWFIMVPIIYLCGIILKLPLYQTIGFGFIYETTISILVYFRIRGNSWIRKVA